MGKQQRIECTFDNRRSGWELLKHAIRLILTGHAVVRISGERDEAQEFDDLMAREPDADPYEEQQRLDRYRKLKANRQVH